MIEEVALLSKDNNSMWKIMHVEHGLNQEIIGGNNGRVGNVLG